MNDDARESAELKERCRLYCGHPDVGPFKSTYERLLVTKLIELLESQEARTKERNGDKGGFARGYDEGWADGHAEGFQKAKRGHYNGF